MSDTGALNVIPEPLKDDFFAIYRKAAVTSREIQAAPVTPSNITFYLFTKDDPNKYVRINKDDLQKVSPYKNSKFAFLIHGWTGDREATWYTEIKDNLLKKGYAVIEVDWKEPANEFYYISSINTYDVAKIITDLILELHQRQGVPLKNILPIGHSLGGHIVGFIGQKVYEYTGQKLPRIVALDPAGPLFDVRPADKRLNNTSADVVHVIHTDGGTFGYKDVIGTIDFFVNGGSSQPGCKRVDLADLKTITEPLSCDHRRAPFLFAEALAYPHEYIAQKCDSWDDFKEDKCQNGEKVAMGDLNTKSRGKFYLKTGKDRPFFKIEEEEEKKAAEKEVEKVVEKGTDKTQDGNDNRPSEGDKNRGPLEFIKDKTRSIIG
nr:unnamed protein product [Callosobruchus analis]